MTVKFYPKSKEYVDLETGEKIHAESITKIAYGHKQFWKLYLTDFLQILGVIDSKQINVLMYILENAQPSTNQFIGTITKIQEATGISRGTIHSTLTKLQEAKDGNGQPFLYKIQLGVYLINPMIMMKGDDKKRNILLKYHEESIDGAKEQNREKAKREYQKKKEEEEDRVVYNAIQEEYGEAEAVRIIEERKKKRQPEAEAEIEEPEDEFDEEYPEEFEE